MLLRISAIILLLSSILFWPFWVSAILGLAGIVYFNVFWEAAAMFLLSDVMYGTREAKFLNMVYITFVISVIILLVVDILKKNSNFEFKEK